MDLQIFYQCFAFHTTAQTSSVANLSTPADRGRQICGQENLSPLGLAGLHRAKNLLVPIHQSMTFSLYLYLKSFYCMVKLQFGCFEYSPNSLICNLMKFYLLQQEFASVKSLMNFDMTSTVLNLQQKKSKGATTKIQVKRIKRDIRIIILFSDNVTNNTVMQ